MKSDPEKPGPSVEVLDARFVASATDERQLPAPAFAEIAFAGRSNVGKSSLINRLLSRRRLVRTSGTPGCTRGLSLFRAQLRLDGQKAVVDLVDLPGYGYAKRSKDERRSWGPMIETFLERRAGLRAVVVILDVRREVQPDDRALFEYLDHIGQRSVAVVTKLDKLPQSRRKPATARIATAIARPVHGVSAHTGLGLDALWPTLRKFWGQVH